MLRCLRVSALTFAMLSTSFAPALAQSTCAPEKLAAAIDVYGNDNFGALAWRKLNGLGVPDVQVDSSSYDDYFSRDGFEKIAAKFVPEISEFKNIGYECRTTYPSKVITARISTLGDQHPYIKQWFKSQAAVIRACSGTSPDVALPTPLDTAGEAATLQNFDRAYQEASIYFYRDKSKAAEKFRAIAATQSPHKASARYNVANLLANGKDIAGARKEAKAILADPTLSSVHDITKALLGYISNLEDTPEGWTELIDNTIATLSQPEAAIVATADSRKAYAAAQYDIGYAGITNKVDDWWVTNTLPENPTLSKAVADAARKQPMALWMLTGQSIYHQQTLAPWTLIGPKWQAWATSYVDRAMALQPASSQIPALPRSLIDSLKAGSDDASRARLWSLAKDAGAKAASTCGEAPETAAVLIYALQASRVSAMAGKYDEIYANLPTLPLANTTSYIDLVLPKITESILANGNLEEGRRLREALLPESFFVGPEPKSYYRSRSNYAEFLGFVAEDETHWLQALAHADPKLKSTLLNLLPAKKLRELAGNSMFNPEQQALLARAAWTRNFARGLGNKDEVTKDMLTRNPEIAASFEKVKADYPGIKTTNAWALTILRNPRFGILVNTPDYSDAIETKREVFAALDEYDHNDKNWWCPLETDRQLGALRTAYDSAAGMEAARGYDAKKLAVVFEADAIAKADAARDAALKANPMVKQIDWTEVKALATMASAPKFLSQQAMRWAKSSAGKDGADEALAQAVLTTRYGCKWHGGHGAYSKAAQELLKTKFATSTWTASTPYWFDCMDSVYDAEYNKVKSCKPRVWPKQSIPR